MTPPTEYQTERWVSATWTIESGMGLAIFTPAPAPDGSTAPSQQVNFLVEGVTLLGPTRELQTVLQTGANLVMVVCVDSATGLQVPAGPVSEGDAASACEDVV